MKKLIPIVFILCMAGISVFAQSLTLTRGAFNILNGDTVTAAGDAADLLIVCNDVDVTNNAGATLSVKCLRTEIQLVAGSTNVFCWGGQCWPESVSLSPDPNIINSGITVTEFSSDYSPNNHAGVSIIRYRFFDMNNISDSICFIAKFVATVGINEDVNFGEVSDAYPNPANNFTTVSYKLTSENNSAHITINNLLGEQVAFIPVIEKEGKIRIETSSLPNGLYFYSFTKKDKVIYTKKLVVRH